MIVRKSLKKYIGTRQFYAGVYYVAMPILVQSLITNFVSLLDNLMVGRVGTEPMSGVAIINQFNFVFMIGLVGIVAGPGVFGAQFFGKKDIEGVRHSFRFRTAAGCLFLIGTMLILRFYGDALINSYLHNGEIGLDLDATFRYAKDYLNVVKWGFVPFTFTQMYASTLREVQETKMPMVASIWAVAVNLTFNYILIYGHFGAPALGVVGAAIATVLSRIVEALIVIIWTHTHPLQAPHAEGLYRTFRIPADLIKKMFVVSFPLFINEFLWSTGQTMLNRFMSERGLEVISAINISSTVSNLFSTIYISMGVALSIIIGNILGAGKEEEAIETDRKLIALSCASTLIVAVIGVSLSSVFPMLYNTQPDVRVLAASFIRIVAFYLPVDAVMTSCYFTIRSGGKTFITFLFDSCFVWVVNMPAVFLLIRYTELPITPVYAIVLGTNIIKLVIGVILVKKKIWVNNLVK